MNIRPPAGSRRPMQPRPLRTGEPVMLAGYQNPWTVKATSEHFAVLTRPATDTDRAAFLAAQQENAWGREELPGDVFYTVLDWRNGVRGPCNLAGRSYGSGDYTAAECAAMLAEFEAGDLEVSHRDGVPIEFADEVPGVTPTIGQMIAETRANNIRLGWRRPEGGPGANTLGDYVALLHEELGEAVKAYRAWKLEDATDLTHWNVAGLSKPEGVGSEFADLLIRLLDTGDVFGFTVFDQDMQVGDVADLPAEPLFTLKTFGDHIAWIGFHIGQMWCAPFFEAPLVLRALVTTARRHGIDLDFEYARKTAYNRTRQFRHGGALAETGA
jgi:hypothetical protein